MLNYGLWAIDYPINTMHLAYSAIGTTNNDHQSSTKQQTDNERLLRYRIYRLTCEKYRHEIAAIQKYIPGWLPEFR